VFWVITRFEQHRTFWVWSRIGRAPPCLLEAIFQLFWNVQNTNTAEWATPAFLNAALLVGHNSNNKTARPQWKNTLPGGPRKASGGSP
jgi:hypothetical protein